jgi:hypothetical protein
MASTTNNIDADEYSEDQQHVEPGQRSSNSKKAKTWRMQNFSDSSGQKQNCKIVYFLLLCYIICYSVNKKTLLLVCYHLAIDMWFYMNNSNAYNFLLLKLVIATSHGRPMQVFNDLYHSNRCKIISIGIAERA